MNRSKIEWCDHTWNPITGCRHNCPYCYARRMTARFAGDVRLNLMAKKDYSLVPAADGGEALYVLDEPMLNETGKPLVYPFGFAPTLHRYRLNTMDKLKMGNNIFVGAMADVFGCYDEDTEVFTKHGWRFFRDLTKDDLVGYLEESSGYLKYSKPITITKIPYKGIMYRVKTRVIDLCITPNHKMYVAKRPTTVKGRNCFKHEWQYHLVSANELYGSSYCLKRDFMWEGKEKENFIVPGVGVSIPMDLWLRFLGYFISEGSAFTTNGRNRVSMPQKKGKNDFYDVCEKIAELLGNKLQMGKDRCVIQNVYLKEYLEQLGHSYSKYLPDEYKELSSRQLRILLDTLIEGDGRIIKSTKSEAYSYYTTSKKLADDVQEIACKCGFVANITSRKPRNRGMICGHVAKANYTCYEVIITSKCRRPEIYSKRNELRGGKCTEWYESYEGHVYCCEVPGHILFVRRNGKTCWCGNSWVPDAWIREVIGACMKYPIHNFLFLTKNPERYMQYGVPVGFENLWYGTSVTKESEIERMNYLPEHCRTFVSAEPLLEDLRLGEHRIELEGLDWIILGAETGRQKGRVVPKWDWIKGIVTEADSMGIPVFMKESLLEIVGEGNMRREFPKQLRKSEISEKMKKKLYGNCSVCNSHLKKGEMITLLARSKRGEQPKQFGFMCKDCFRKFCKDLGLDIPELAGLAESITIGPGDENG